MLCNAVLKEAEKHSSYFSWVFRKVYTSENYLLVRTLKEVENRSECLNEFEWRTAGEDAWWQQCFCRLQSCCNRIPLSVWLKAVHGEPHSYPEEHPSLHKVTQENGKRWEKASNVGVGCGGAWATDAQGSFGCCGLCLAACWLTACRLGDFVTCRLKTVVVPCLWVSFLIW